MSDCELLEEDVHARIESSAVPLLVALRNGDLGLFDDPERYSTFVGFIAFQHLRTPRAMKRVLDWPTDKFGHSNVHAAWGLLRTMLATTLGAGLAARRDMLRVTLLSASGEEFITGDQPTVNTRSRGLAKGVAPTSTEIYYPLSPTLALLMTFDTERGTDRRTLSPEQTHEFNVLISEVSDLQIYASRESTLARLPAQVSEP